MAILITAALTGIGQEIVKQLREKKLEPILTTSNLSKVNEDENIFFFDLSQKESAKSLLKKLKDRSIEIDTIYHCAHQFSAQKLFLSLSYDDLSSGLVTNVAGTFELLKVFLKPMIRRNKGEVIVIGSLVAKRIAPGKVQYIIEKNAIESCLKAIKSEIADKNIVLKIIHPGLVSTEQVKKKISESVIDHIGQENLISVQSVARQCIEFLNDKSNQDFSKEYGENQKW